MALILQKDLIVNQPYIIDLISIINDCLQQEHNNNEYSGSQKNPFHGLAGTQVRGYAVFALCFDIGA